MHLIQEMGIAALASVIIAFVPAVAAVAYAIWPTESKLALMRPLSLASLFAGLGGLTTGLINVLHSVGNRGIPLSSGPVLAGAAESLVPLGVAFGSLTLAWLLVALGMRRRA